MSVSSNFFFQCGSMWLVNELFHIFSAPIYCLKTSKFDDNSGSDFSHKTNTFSYDENVKK